MRRIAIIPARSGSKRIKNKNIVKFYDQPLISYSILAAIRSKKFDHIFVSTDSKKIASISRQYGATIPFLRDKKLSSDNVSTIDVISNACKNLIDLNYVFDEVMCIYPSSPLINFKNIIKAVKLFEPKKMSYLLSIGEYNSNPFSNFLLNKNNKIVVGKNFDNTSKYTKSEFYHDSGQLYLSTKENWLKKSKIFTNKSYGMLIKRHENQDINTLKDLEFAKLLFKLNINQSNNANIKKYLGVIDKIEKTRSKNNINWMDLLRLSMVSNPDRTLKLVGKINKSDKEISNLLSLLK